jgi:hypothetical protein
VAEWSHVEDGKVTMVRVVFDARPFAGAQPTRPQAKERYRLLMTHYGVEATTNNLGVAHENGMWSGSTDSSNMPSIRRCPRQPRFR